MVFDVRWLARLHLLKILDLTKGVKKVFNSGHARPLEYLGFIITTEGGKWPLKSDLLTFMITILKCLSCCMYFFGDSNNLVTFYFPGQQWFFWVEMQFTFCAQWTWRSLKCVSDTDTHFYTFNLMQNKKAFYRWTF